MVCYSKFIHLKYHMDPKVSAYIAGAVYDVSMVLSPFLGGIIVSTICNIQCIIAEMKKTWVRNTNVLYHAYFNRRAVSL